jgi:hypothetical protein
MFYILAHTKKAVRGSNVEITQEFVDPLYFFTFVNFYDKTG